MFGQNILKADEQDRWEYLTKTEDWSITVVQDSVILQSTAYQQFEEFANQLLLAASTTLTVTENNNLGLIQRIGLRYINVIQVDGEKDFRFYLRSQLHGLDDGVFEANTRRYRIENVGRTLVGEDKGIMVVRISQSDKGYDLPLDLLPNAPKRQPKRNIKPGEVVTFLDIDHYIEGNFEPDINWIEGKAYQLHDHIVETLHDHVLTKEAVEEWQ